MTCCQTTQADLCGPSGPSHRQDAIFDSLLDELELGPAYDLITTALDNAGCAERRFKRAGRASVLGIDSEHDRALGNAFHHRSLAQLAAAGEAIGQALERLDLEEHSCAGVDEAVAGPEFSGVVEAELLPALREVLLGSRATPTEARLIYATFDAPDRWSAPVREDLEEIRSGIARLAEVRGAKRRGQEIGDEGVPLWKELAVAVLSGLIRVLIKLCRVRIPVLCGAVDRLWRALERWLVQKLFEACRQSPAGKGQAV